MSLINKMLQDLDARGASLEPGAEHSVRPVPGREAARRFVLPGAVLVLLALAAALAWYLLQRPLAPGPVPAAAARPQAQSVVLTAAPPAVAAPDVPAVPIPAAPKAAIEADAASAMPRPRPAPHAAPATHLNVAMPASSLPDRITLAAAAPPPDALAPAPPALNPRLRAENEYRRALAALQDGRVMPAIAGLEQALALDPGHQAARQTLVGLLLENGKVDDAIVQLQLGLGLDVQQPELAMVLARLQVDRGGPALETLLRTLPYAEGNGAYQAFLAAVLEREGRHQEAAGHYQLALRTAPQNGLWWMGLGISLQADKKLPDARAAFAHAKAAGQLTPELQAFVERKLQQLAP